MKLYLPIDPASGLVPTVTEEHPGFLIVAVLGPRSRLSSIADHYSGQFVPVSADAQDVREWSLNRSYLLSPIATYIVRVGGAELATLTLTKLAREGDKPVAGVRVTIDKDGRDFHFGAMVAGYQVGAEWQEYGIEKRLTRFDRIVV